MAGAFVLIAPVAATGVLSDTDPTEDDMTDLYITTSIPYVNGAPHLGHALEFVHVDALARHHRLRGGRARVQSGTDDHAIKNVSAAETAGVPVADLVATNGIRFA